FPEDESLAAALAGRYRLVRPLGRVGMATVHRAEDLKHPRKVAVKVLRPELATSIGLERFSREIEIAAALSHPHILAVHDSGGAAGVLYYVMPYVEGESWRGRLSRESRLPLEEALRITREVADALGYAHHRGLIHRDIKPENILLQAGHAVVADFGIARAITAAAAGGTLGRTLTLPGMPIGTPDYMSPEQALGERELDGRCDQYALACVLYEMLAARPSRSGSPARGCSPSPGRAAAARPVSPSRWRAAWAHATRTVSPGSSSPPCRIPSSSRTTSPTRWACAATASDRPGRPCSRRCAIGTRCWCWTTASIWSRPAPGWRTRC